LDSQDPSAIPIKENVLASKPTQLEDNKRGRLGKRANGAQPKKLNDARKGNEAGKSGQRRLAVRPTAPAQAKVVFAYTLFFLYQLISVIKYSR